jgi:broad specificity phosphatase PhoE
MIRLLLVASAPTAATRRAAFPLDEAIDTAAIGAAAMLRGAARTPDLALVAPELRARQTAAAIGLAEPLVDGSLRDLDHGAWAGASVTDIGQRDAEGLRRWMSDPQAAPHGGESVAALCDRVRGALARLAATGGAVTAVTHPAVMRAAIVAALDAPLTAFWSIDIAPLARLTLHADGARWRLRAIENSKGRKRDCA